MEERISRLRALLDKNEVDSLLVSDPVNVRYLTGFTGDSTYLWVGRSRATLLSDGRFETQIRDQCGDDVAAAIRPPSMKMHQLIAEVHDAVEHGRRVGFESDQLTVAAFEQIRGKTEVDWRSTTGVVAAMRMIKDDAEIAKIERSVQIAEQALLEVCLPDGIDGPLRIGDQTERELAFALEAAMRRRGATGTSFDTIVAAGAASALPHYQPSGATIGDASVLLVDWGAMVDGYASDMTRTFHGPRAGDEFDRCYDAVLAAHDAAAAAIRPGVLVGEVDAAARQSLAAAGLADRFVHSTGHGFGMEVHEPPRLADGETLTLAAGMVITIEPGAYLPDRFGIRLENDYLVTETSSRRLGGGIPLGLEASRRIG